MSFKRLESHLICLETIDSTNNYAAELLKKSVVSNGTVVMAKRQTTGKGQRGNSWQSEDDKNLIFSIILFPGLKSGEAFNLNIAISLAVQKTLDYHLKNVTIKWPNDIFVGDKKIAGILIENQLRNDQIVSSIAGIGINVNQEKFDDLFNACSFKTELNMDFDLIKLFDELYLNLDFYVNLLSDKNFKVLLSRYYEKLYRFNHRSIFEDNSGKFYGIIRGIDERGKLIIHREGVPIHYDLKEIKFIYTDQA